MKPTLEVDITCALERFSLACRFTTSARVVGVFGPSGAGKTQLLDAVAGLRPGVAGTIRCRGVTWLDAWRDGARGAWRARHGGRPTRRAASARGVGYAPQAAHLFPHWTVRANLLAGAPRAAARGLDPDALLEEVVALFGLRELVDRMPASLSGGERQRVALGRAVCSGAELLLLDEPFAALDRPLRRRLLPFLLRLRERDETPILFVSHDPSEIQALCDEVVVLSRGQVIEQGPPSKVLAPHLEDRLAGDRLRADGLGTDDPETDGTSTLEIDLECLLPGRWVEPEANRSGLGQVALGAEGGGPRLTVASRGAGSVLVGIRTKDVLLASRPVSGLSARNVLAGRIVAIEKAVAGRMVSVDLSSPGHGAPGTPVLEPSYLGPSFLGPPFLGAHVTEEAMRDLDLTVGSRVWVVVKSTAIQAYPID